MQEGEQILITAVIPTYKREVWLARSVNSILEQGLSADELEVIVVNDSGEPLGDALWQSDSRVRVLTTYRVERCVARNLGAALSQGKYLHFLDDDDYLLPGAYSQLLDRAEQTGATWTYGAYNLVDDNGRQIGDTMLPWVRGRVFALALAGLAIPGGVSLVRRDAFFEAGCFDVEMLVQQDTELLQRISVLGATEYTRGVVANYRTGVTEVSTTKWSRSDKMGDMKKEKAFIMPCCVGEIELCFAERERKEVRGKLVRYYLGSAARHTKQHAYLTALSRVGIAIRLALRGLLSSNFWAGLRGKS